MTNPIQHIVIIGCGRLGAELASSIATQGIEVSVIDSEQKAFAQLSSTFTGRTVQGDAFQEQTLQRAGIREAHAVATVTASDSVNIVLARVARDYYKVPHVVARVYNPQTAPVYDKLNIQTVSSSTWGAKRIEQIILHTGLQSIHTAGNGEVQIYEMLVTEGLHGRTIRAVLAANSAPVAVVRGGRALLATPDFVLQAEDLLQFSATREGIAAVRQQYIAA